LTGQGIYSLCIIIQCAFEELCTWKSNHFFRAETGINPRSIIENSKTQACSKSKYTRSGSSLCYTYSMLEITPAVSIDENEIQIDFVRASGPGGQNVNKVSTAAQLRFDIRNSPSLETAVKERLVRLAGSRVTEAGILVIDARRFRTQEQNRLDAIQRLLGLVRRALEQPKARRKTRPTLASKQKRLQTKRRHSEKKRLRGRLTLDETR
jgi:ribosome-associated protein